jgi:transposase
VAKVAMSHGVNANLVHGWRKLERERHQAAAGAVQAQAVVPAVTAPASSAPFLPVTIVSAGGAIIDIEVRRGAVTMKVSWPMSAASQCAAWARELLK